VAFGWDKLARDGTQLGLWGMGAICYILVVISVNFRLALEVHFWTWISHTVFWASVLSWFLWMSVYSSFPVFVFGAGDSQVYWVAYKVMSASSFWVLLFVVPIIALIPNVVFKSWTFFVRPRDAQVAREQHYSESRNIEKGRETDYLLQGQAHPAFTLILPTFMQKNTGYAFAEERGTAEALQTWFRKIHKKNAQEK